MATRNGVRNRMGPTIRSFGRYTIHGTPGQARLTLSRDLFDEGFPADVGDEVVVEMIEPEDGEPYLEIRPGN